MAGYFVCQCVHQRTHSNVDTVCSKRRYIVYAGVRISACDPVGKTDTEERTQSMEMVINLERLDVSKLSDVMASHLYRLGELIE